MLKMMLRAGITALLVIIMLVPAGGTVYVQGNESDSPVFRSVDLPFNFNDTIMPVYTLFANLGLDFLNADFRSFDLEEGDNFSIIRLAEYYLPIQYFEDLCIINAEQLAVFIEEVFGLELPLKTVGMYKYSEDENVFIYPVANGGQNLSIWKIAGITENNDGTLTVTADFYMIGMTLDAYEDNEHIYWYDFVIEEIAKPTTLWDERINSGRVVRSEITFRLNDDYTYFPMQFIGVETELHDWKEASGTYVSEDSRFIISFGMDNRYDMPPYRENFRLNSLITDMRQQRSFWVHGYIFHNAVELHTSSYSLHTFLTLNPDGTIYVSDYIGQYGVDLSGTYTKISDDVPPLPAKFSFTWYWPDVHEDFTAYYMISEITGLGCGEFDEYVSQYIADAIHARFNYLFGDPHEYYEGYYFLSNLFLVTQSDFYYALAESLTYSYAGAHGFEVVRVFNINANSGKILTLDDIFTEGYRPILEEILSEMALTELYEGLLYSAEITLTDNIEFFLSDNRLVIFFPEYEIAPYSSGIIRFSVPFAAISHILLEEYLQGNLMREITDDMLFR